MEGKDSYIRDNRISDFTERYIISRANQKLSYDEIHDIKVSMLRTFGLGTLVGGGAAFFKLRQIIINETRGIFLTFGQKSYRIIKFGLIGFVLSLPYSFKYNFSDVSRSFVLQTPYRAAYIYTHQQREINNGTSPILPSIIDDGGILKSKLFNPKEKKLVPIEKEGNEENEESEES